MTILGKCARSHANSAEPHPRVSIPARDYSDVDLSATDAIVLAGVHPARRRYRERSDHCLHGQAFRSAARIGDNNRDGLPGVGGLSEASPRLV